MQTASAHMEYFVSIGSVDGMHCLLNLSKNDEFDAKFGLAAIIAMQEKQLFCQSDAHVVICSVMSKGNRIATVFSGLLQAAHDTRSISSKDAQRLLYTCLISTRAPGAKLSGVFVSQQTKTAPLQTRHFLASPLYHVIDKDRVSIYDPAIVLGGKETTFHEFVTLRNERPVVLVQA
jgi:hypothetical protein